MLKTLALAQLSAPVNRRAQEIVQEQIAVGHGGERSAQRQVTREPKRSRSSRGLTAVVGLRRARRNHGVAALRDGFRQQKFELARLVAAECEPGEVVALDPKSRATEAPGQPPHLHERGREKTQRAPRQRFLDRSH